MNTQESLAVPQADSALVGGSSHGLRLLWLGIGFGAGTGALTSGVALAILLLAIALGETSFQHVLARMSIIVGSALFGALLGAIFGALLGLGIGLHRVIFQRNSVHPLVWALLAGLGSAVGFSFADALLGGFGPLPFLIIAAISALFTGLTALWLARSAPPPSTDGAGRLRTTLLSLVAGFLLMIWQAPAMVLVLIWIYPYCCAQ